MLRFTAARFARNALLSRTASNSTFHREPYQPLPGKVPNVVTAAEAVKVVKSGDHIFIQGVASTPTPLMEALTDHVKQSNLHNVNLYHIHLEGAARWSLPEYSEHIRSNCFFVAGNLRAAVNEGRADVLSIFLSETALVFRRKVIPVDVAFISVSPPDSHGYCSLGTSVDCTRAALENSKAIIALSNANVPRTFGDAGIHMSHIDFMVEENYPLYKIPDRPPGEAEKRIGRWISENLVEDGCTLQTGIGTIPDSVLSGLKQHKNLGLHTEMFSDGVLALIACGALNNSQKTFQRGKLVSSFALGSENLYKWMHDNPMLYMADVAWTNDPAIIKQNPKVCAINSGIEIDLTGQIVSDSIGTRMYSGFGGQVDFIRGAAIGLDNKGKAILALPSVTKRNESKIVPLIKPGAGVVTTRAHAHYIVTEHGIASLFGKNFRQRAHSLISIAHPDHRQMLEKAFHDRFKVMPSAD